MNDKLKILAAIMIDVALSIAYDQGGNSGCTHYDNYCDRLVELGLDIYSDTFEDELQVIIMHDKRVIGCEVNALGDTDVDIVFSDETIKNVNN